MEPIRSVSGQRSELAVGLAIGVLVFSDAPILAGCEESAPVDPTPDACVGTTFVKSRQCARALIALCAAHDSELECDAELPVEFDFATMRCGWAKAVVISDRATCEVGAVRGQCYALFVHSEGEGTCVDECSGDPDAVLVAVDRDAALLDLPCFGQTALRSPLFEEVVDDDAENYPARQCRDPSPCPQLPLCDCVPQACAALRE